MGRKITKVANINLAVILFILSLRNLKMRIECANVLERLDDVILLNT